MLLLKFWKDKKEEDRKQNFNIFTVFLLNNTFHNYELTCIALTYKLYYLSFSYLGFGIIGSVLTNCHIGL